MLGDRKDPALFNGVGAGKPNPRSGTKVVSERGRTIVKSSGGQEKAEQFSRACDWG